MLIEEIEKDITYFTNIGFTNIAGKFQACVDAIKQLQHELEETRKNQNNTNNSN